MLISRQFYLKNLERLQNLPIKVHELNADVDVDVRLGREAIVGSTPIDMWTKTLCCVIMLSTRGCRTRTSLKWTSRISVDGRNVFRLPTGLWSRDFLWSTVIIRPVDKPDDTGCYSRYFCSFESSLSIAYLNFEVQTDTSDAKELAISPLIQSDLSVYPVKPRRTK